MLSNRQSCKYMDFFVLKDVLGELETPGGKSNPGERVGTPLTDVIHRKIKVALANSSQNSALDMQATSASPQLAKTIETEVNQNTAACHI